MGMWVWVGFLAFFVASLVVGTRLVLLWSRTRELPELLIGLGVLGIGPIGFGGQRVAQAILQNVRAADPEAAIPGSVAVLMLVGGTAASIGVGCKLVFNTRVYHADNKLMRGFMWAGIAAAVTLLAVRIAVGDLMPHPMPTNLAHMQSFAQIGVLLWGSYEALHYWAQMRRRVMLGLADPTVSNRFLLWGIGAGAAGMGSLIGSVAGIVIGRPNFQIEWVVASSSIHGLVAAVALSLAFVPPASYLRWVRSHSASPAA